MDATANHVREDACKSCQIQAVDRLRNSLPLMEWQRPKKQQTQILSYLFAKNLHLGIGCISPAIKVGSGHYGIRPTILQYY